MEKHTSYLLIILDGFGYRADKQANAIANANTPTIDRLLQTYPNTLIATSGMSVGLPEGQMGNSEVGHMNLGAGRIVYQNYTRISKAIDDGVFFNNPTLLSSADSCIKNDKTLHIMGLLSPGGVHSHEQHISAMIKLAHRRGVKRIMVHAFLDGRDTPPRSAEQSLTNIDKQLKDTGCGHIASIIGRYYAMDRDQRWDRVELAYDLLTKGEAQHQYDTPLSGLHAAYEREENDEFVAPTLIKNPQEKITDVTIQDGDALVFMNFRADRAREISKAFTDKDFDGFSRKEIPKIASFTSLTHYADDIKANVAFKPEPLNNVLGEVIADQGMSQLRIAETEKYAHVTFFFSGGREDNFKGEERTLVTSPDVPTYDLQPEMSAPEVTEKLVAAINSNQYDLIVCNYANGDMVGHTGKYEAAIEAIEALDNCLKTVEKAIVDTGSECLITADHGNAEQMLDPLSGQAHTAHTCEPVPLIYIGRPANIAAGGALSDIAPTLLSLMGLTPPAEMTGQTLIELL